MVERNRAVIDDIAAHAARRAAIAELQGAGVDLRAARVGVVAGQCQRICATLRERPGAGDRAGEVAAAVDRQRARAELERPAAAVAVERAQRQVITVRVQRAAVQRKRSRTERCAAAERDGAVVEGRAAAVGIRSAQRQVGRAVLRQASRARYRAAQGQIRRPADGQARTKVDRVGNGDGRRAIERGGGR